MHLFPERGQREAVVARVGEGNARGGDHAALAHGEAGDDGEGEDGEGGVLGQALDQVAGEGLADGGGEGGGDVYDCVGYYELEEPADCATDGAGEDDGAGGGDVCV